jgi:alkylation response protein AidB-like acyl-CoA dehydrogenase
VAWPAEYGGRGLTLHQQVVYFEEYARARAPGRIGHIGETLLGPTLIAFGTEAQRQRFLPGIVAGTELWCQGYSEPGAGSDLANIQTRAHIADGQWVIDGQKVWTSQAHWADWCFVLARTNGAVAKHKGISYLLVPMHQDGIETRPIHQLTGDSEFNEVFFTGATTEADHVVGAIDDGWRVAMGTLAYERGASTLGQNLMFLNEWDEVLALAQHNGRVADPVIRQRLLDTWIRLRLMRLNAMRIMSSAHEAPPAAMITKLFWATLHRDLGELAMDVVGPHAMIRTGDDADFSRLQRLFLFSRSDTIYAGSNQIQRNIIGERALGLPKEPSR